MPATRSETRLKIISQFLIIKITIGDDRFQRRGGAFPSLTRTRHATICCARGHRTPLAQSSQLVIISDDTVKGRTIKPRIRLVPFTIQVQNSILFIHGSIIPLTNNKANTQIGFSAPALDKVIGLKLTNPERNRLDAADRNTEFL